MAEHILNRVLLRPVRKIKDDGHVEETRSISHVEKIIVADMETEDFVKAMEIYEKTGDFVKAMEIIHGHGRFNWFYELFDNVFKRLFRKE